MASYMLFSFLSPDTTLPVHPSPGCVCLQAAFSNAWQCIDTHAENQESEWVCLKIIKNSKVRCTVKERSHCSLPSYVQPF